MSDAQPVSEDSDSEGLRARLCALSLLDDVLQRKQPLDQALDQNERLRSLPVRDRGFVRMMVSTTLRRLGQLDELIAKAVEKEPPSNITLMNILRLGFTQIAFMDVPDHAALDTSVRLTEHHNMERQKGFVNGVLRTMTRVGREWLERQDEGRVNTPEWLLKIWIEDYGLREAAEIAKANLSEAPLDITIRDEASRNYWASQFKATEMTTGTLRKTAGGQVQDFEGFDDGHWWVQDASAAIPVKLLGDIAGQSVVDLCAAPGGKTMQLAALGAEVIALDRSNGRLKRLAQNLERTGFTDKVEIVTSDAANWKPREAVPYILLDAPCSATGTVRRNPDVLHLKMPQDLERLEAVQARILGNAFEILMPGGVLVYCTCSLQKSEGEHQIDRLLSAQPMASRLPIVASELGGFDEAITPEGDLRILPFHQAALGGMDGFFISRITKRAV